jgi:hypothetical protein
MATDAQEAITADIELVQYMMDLTLEAVSVRSLS